MEEYVKKYICKFCGKEFDNPRKLGGHTSKCKLNPNYNTNITNIILKRILPRFTYTCNCVVCNNTYNITCTENDYNKQKYRLTCSDKCSSILTQSKTNKEEKNKKISDTAIKKILNNDINLNNDDKKLIYNEKKRIRGINLVRSKEKYKSYNFREIQLYECDKCGQKHCTNEICKKWNFQAILTLIKYFKFNPQALGTIDFFNELNRIKADLEDIYIKEGSGGILKKYNYPEKHIGNIFKRFNIQRKTISDAVSLNYKLGKLGNQHNQNTQFKTEYHNTWDNKQYFLRSSYETDYANILDDQKISYLVESMRIQYFDTQKNKQRIAIPDFYLPETNTIVEIKSSWTLDIQNMKDKFIAYKKLGYNTKLIYEHKEVDINTIL